MAGMHDSYRSWWRIPRKILFHWNRGTIVYDQNFIWYSSLSKDGSEGFVQEFEAIMHWYHSAYHKLHSIEIVIPRRKQTQSIVAALR
jgi:hypothetical protein